MHQQLLKNLVEDYMSMLVDRGCTDLFDDDPLLDDFDNNQEIIDRFEGSAVNLVQWIKDQMN